MSLDNGCAAAWSNGSTLKHSFGKVRVQMPFVLSSARSIETSADLPGGRVHVDDWLTDPDGQRLSPRLM